MKYAGVLLMSDIDGTLLNNERKMSEENRAAIASFMAQGGRFTIATGRVPAAASLYLDGICPNMPGVCCNGGILYDFAAKQVLRSFPFEAADTESIVPILNTLHETMPEVSINLDTLYGPSYLGHNAMTDRLCRLLQWHDPRYLTRAEEQREPVLRVALGFDETQEKALQAFLAAQTFPEGLRLLRTDEIFYELIPHFVNKAYAVTQSFWPCEGVDTLVYVGDSENDAEMLRLADRSFAPSNAMTAALSAAKEILPVTNDEHAVAAVIARL